jgi:hypothetical protein
MARPRKTITIESLVKYANGHLARTDEYADVKFKSGVTVLIETALLRSECYNGFMFINNDDSEVGTLGYFSRRYFI